MDRMYLERKGNIAAFRGCNYFCNYCNFRSSLKRSSCTKCQIFEPHSHLETLQRVPPKTREGEFLTVGLAGDISFMEPFDFVVVLDYCTNWEDRTFMIQSKNPDYFVGFGIPGNVIIGTTIETNREYLSRGVGDLEMYHEISKAPHPMQRIRAMQSLKCRKAITIEPIMLFDIDILSQFLGSAKPEFVYIGYDSEPRRNFLPEPGLADTNELIDTLSEFTEVRPKLIRNAWWE